MAGIVSYGAYVPIYRLDRKLIPGGGIPGEKAVANFDEDSITMGVAATMDCLQEMDAQMVGRLCFASTTMPYKERQCANIVAMAAGLPENIGTLDITGSLRSGTNALDAALDAVKGSAVAQAIAVAADCRPATPGSDHEKIYGDGAAALLLGNSNVIATIEASYSLTDDVIDVWRMDGDDFVKNWEDRFIQVGGYVPTMKKAVTGLMKQSNLKPADFSKVVFYGHDPRNHLAAVTGCGFDPKTQLQDPMFAVMGNTGTAFALMQLVAALENAKSGDRILMASYGEGCCNCYALMVTDEIEKARDRRGMKGHLASKKAMPSYEMYINFHKLMPTEAARRLPEPSSAPQMWRDRNQVLKLHGCRCRNCNNLQFPIQRVCAYCQTIDDYEEVRFAEKKAKIFTYTLDNLAATPDSPMAKAVIDFEGGGRTFTQVTDRNPEEIKIDLPVEMTFRKYNEAAGFNNYFWKCRPIR